MKLCSFCIFFTGTSVCQTHHLIESVTNYDVSAPPKYKYTDLSAEQKPKQQTAPHTTSTSTHHTAPNMHEADEEQPPPPLPQRATDNLAPEYFKGLSTENADLWMTSIENWRSYRKINKEQTKAAIPLFFRDGAAHWYQALGR